MWIWSKDTTIRRIPSLLSNRSSRNAGLGSKTLTNEPKALATIVTDIE